MKDPVQIHPKSPLLRHPLACLFPMMDTAQMEVHKGSLKRSGQKTPIVLFEGMVLDGSNTHFGCLELGLEPEYRQFGSDPKDGDSPADFVIIRNLERRHLSPSARTAAAVEVVPFYEAEAAKRIQATQFKPKAEAAISSAANAPADAGEGLSLEITQDTAGTAEEGAAGATGEGFSSPAGVVETPTPKPTATKGTAVQQAANAFNVSPTYVKLGKKLKRKAADLWEKVTNQEMTIAEADAAWQQREKDAKNNVSAQAKRTERLEALKVLEKRFAKHRAFLDAVTQKKLIKDHSDLLEFADLNKTKAFTILPLIKLGWKTKKAVAYIDAQATEDSTVNDLIAMAHMANPEKQAHDEITRAFVVNGWTVTLHREASEPTNPEMPPEESSEQEEETDDNTPAA